MNKPKNLSQFIGKEEIIKSIRVGIKASKISSKSLDHILLYGPPGVGKTSLANAIAQELGVKIKIVQGANIGEVSDLMGIISTLKSGDILFIDEIHTVRQETAEILYPALENKAIDMIVGKSLNKKSIRVPLPDFTVIAATTNLGDITKSLEERFGYVFYLEAYKPEEMYEIIKRAAEEMNLNLNKEKIERIIESSRGIPRNSMRILRRIKDYEVAQEDASVETIIRECGFVYKGLSSIDIKYLMALQDNCYSLASISHRINVDKKTIINKIEPYMYSNGWVVKNSKGRSLSAEGIEIVNQLMHYLR